MADIQSGLEDFFVSSDSCTAKDLRSAFNSYLEISDQLSVNDPLIFKDLLSRGGGGALFRRTGESKDAETFIWLSQIQRYAELIVSTGNVAAFQGLRIDQMKEISRLSLDVRNLERVSEFLLGFGVVLVYQPQTAGMRTDGVIFKLSCGTPVIGMTLRYDRYDYYWFTLMHELAHLALHFDRFESPHFDCIEGENFDDADIIELQANHAAKESFVSRSDWRTASVRRFHSDEELLKSAANLSVHTAILAGMIRYETGNYRLFNDFINQVSIRRILTPDA